MNGRFVGAGLVVACVLLAVNTVLLTVLVLREPASGSGAGTAVVAVDAGGAAPGTAAETLAPAGDPVETFLRATLRPAAMATADLDGDPDLLPTEAEVQAAVATASLSSPESRAVLDKLRVVYAIYRMPFPESGPSMGGEGTDREALRAWFTVTTETLRGAVEDAGADPSTVLPGPAEVDAAIRSGSLASPESRAAVERLRVGSERYGVRFVPPPGGGP